MPPLVSLIMPTLNADTYIADALNSVVAQNMEDRIEVVIADGGSTDNTLHIARQYDFTRIFERRDNNLYEGFNRGLANAKGELIGFLNSDDFLQQDAMEIVTTAFRDNEQVGYVSCGITQQALKTGQKPDGKLPGLLNGKPLNVKGVLFGIPAINGRFFRSGVVKEIGLFNSEIGLAADREFLLRVHTSGFQSLEVKQCLYHYRVHNRSATIAGDRAAKQRVWQADIELSNYLLRSGLWENYAPTIEQARVLATLKQRMIPETRMKKGMSFTHAFILPHWFRWRHVPVALINWRMCRGKLSGF